MADYLVLPRAGAPAVVVVHDWYGQLTHVRALCDDLASAGFTALAVDLYDGQTAADEAEAERLMEDLDPATAKQQLIQAVRTLRSTEASAPRVSSVSFSMGGQLALRCAQQGLFDAAVSYYAALSPRDAPLPCPVQLHLAEIDDFEPTDLPQQFVDAINDTGGTAQAHTYPGTVHSFANADVQYYESQAAAQAWERTLEFLA